MNIHDLVFAVGAGIFAVSLIPAVVKRAHMPRATSVPTAVVLTVFLVNYATMAFWEAFAVEAVCCACWWYLVFLGGPPSLPLTMSAEQAWRTGHD